MAHVFFSYSSTVNFITIIIPPAQGRTFKSMIQEYLPRHEDLNNVYLQLYATAEGRAIYDETLASVRENFPQYVREMEGTAAGANVDFHKVALMQYNLIN